MILTVLYVAILTVTSYVAITKNRTGIVTRVGFLVGAFRLFFLFLIMHIFDTLRGLLRHEPLLRFCHPWVIADASILL